MAYCVYIMTNRSNKILYIGMTNDIKERVSEHRSKKYKGFSAKYNCAKLVYVEKNKTLNAAQKREKQLKAWRRQWKTDLIEKRNPDWVDLSEHFLH